MFFIDQCGDTLEESTNAVQICSSSAAGFRRQNVINSDFVIHGVCKCPESLFLFAPRHVRQAGLSISQAGLLGISHDSHSTLASQNEEISMSISYV